MSLARSENRIRAWPRPSATHARSTTPTVRGKNPYLPFSISFSRPLAFSAVLTFLSLVLGCGESGTGGGGSGGGPGGMGGGGVGGVVASECRRDQDCLEGFACSGGECFECEHEDPFSGPVQTPEFWSADRFRSGAELGLDPQRAYWEISLTEYGLNGQPAPTVWICDPITLENGGIVETGTDGCEELSADEFRHGSDSLIVPVAPSEWLSSDPVDGLYYTDVRFEFGPIFDCP